MNRHPMIRVPDKLLPERIDPATLAPGDFLRDLGRFRPIASVTSPSDPARSVIRYLVRFADEFEMALGIPAGIDITVWREP